MVSETSDPDIGAALLDKGFLKAFFKLPEKPSAAVRFFERNGFNSSVYYTVYGSDASLAAREHFRSMDNVKSIKWEGEVLDYVNLSRQAFLAFAKHLLLAMQYKVEVFTEQARTGTEHQWRLQYKGSPGNLCSLEDMIFVGNSDVTVSNSVIGVKIAELSYTKTVGVACVNVNDCVVSLIEFEDNEYFSNLESVLVQLAPKEAVLCRTGLQEIDVKRLYQVLDRSTVLITELSPNDFDSKNINQDLANLLRPVAGRAFNFAAHPENAKTQAIAALCGAVKYLELLSDDKFTTQFRLEPFDVHLHVKMDAAACRALDLGLGEGRQAGKATLSGAIDKCRTPQGHRLLAQYFKQPLKDKDKLEERLDLVEAFVEDTVLRQTLYDDLLRRIPDCQMLARKFMKGATLADYYKAYLFCTKVHLIQGALRNYEGSKSAALQVQFCHPLVQLEQQVQKFCKEIEATLDLDAAEKGLFVIRSEVDESLTDLWSEMNLLEEKMSEEMYGVAKLLHLEATKSLKLEMNSQHGHFFRISLKEEPAIRNNSAYKIIDSSKGGIRFRNSELENLSSAYISKHALYEEKQKIFVRDLLERCKAYSFTFETLSGISAKLDVAVSFAVSSVENAEPYVRPKLLGKGSGLIRFKDLRHPCLELQRNITFIPNDVHFEKRSSSFYIVTGPNMGGKSTLLRSVGVATLLAHVGCFVPASEAVVSIVDAILARVGAGDALQKGLSTFMAEMIESSFILQTASSDSLVLIDELGRGTSTYDGFGICWAISEHLLKITDCFCVVATHFHQLTELCQISSSVKNVHFVAIPGESGLQMMHKLQSGSCDRSFGIHVGRVAEFPAPVLEAAQEMVDRLEEVSSDDKDDSKEGVKRRETEKQEGYRFITEVLEKVNALSYRCQQESDWQVGLNEIIVATNDSQLAYIKHIVHGHSAAQQH